MKKKRKAAAKAGGRKAKRPHTDKKGDELGRRVGQGGYAARITIVDRIGDVSDTSEAEWFLHATAGGRGGQTPTGPRRRAVVAPRTCRALAALGHAQRLRIVAKLLEGPGTYRTLQKATKLKPGPLYHHVNQLRLAGLLLPRERDLYELTRGGRNLILTVLALNPLVGDRRRRP